MNNSSNDTRLSTIASIFRDMCEKERATEKRGGVVFFTLWKFSRVCKCNAMCN